MPRLSTLIRRYPAYVAILLLIAFIYLFGVEALAAVIVAAVLIIAFALVLTGDATDDDNDWFNPRGPRPA